VETEWLKALSIYTGRDFSGLSDGAVRELLISNPELMELYSNMTGIETMKAAGSLPVVNSDEISRTTETLGQLAAAGFDASDYEIAEDDGILGDSERNEADDDSLFAKADDSDIEVSPERQIMRESIEDIFGSQAVVEAPESVGDESAPDLFSLNVHQGYSDTCAIKCQELVLEDFGLDVSSEELINIAARNGWYIPGEGTSAAHLDKLLELHGVGTNHYDNANIFNLVSELAQGHRVIVSVDSGELWSQNEVLQSINDIPQELYEDGVADHTIIISGIDVSDPSNPVVVVTDPGTGQVAATYELADFIEAWGDSGFDMIATAEAPQDFTVDHVASIGELPYDTFSQWYHEVEHLNSEQSVFNQICDAFRSWIANPEVAQWTALPAVSTGFVGTAPTDATDLGAVFGGLDEIGLEDLPIFDMDDDDQDLEDFDV